MLVKSIIDALQTEAMATLHGLLFAIDADISKMKNETDASILKTTLTSFDMVVNDALFWDIKFLLYIESVSVKVLNIPRQMLELRWVRA